MKEKLFKLGLFALIIYISLSSVSGRLAVMSIDLGGEYFKVAIVKPGVPMEVALNKESSRKTPTLVAFRDGERHFASEAQTTALKYPQKAFGYLMQIIGRQYDDPQVQLFRKRFPFYDMMKDEERGTVLFRVDEDIIYSVEELLAMILEKAKEYAQDFAEQEIKDAVITVPPFYNQAERRAVLSAARLVGINVLQLMSDNAAVALNYGVFRRKNFNSTTQYYMFYDMGSTSTTATVVGYNVVRSKESIKSDANPQLTVKGVGFDRSLGGLEFTLRLRDHLAKLFNGQKKTPLKAEENSKAMAKLFKEAERVKKVLSANVEHTAQIENLLAEKDFRAPVTRTDLEELTQDLFERVTKPIEEALKLSQITLPEVTEIILMGGSTRMPKVQEILMKYLGRSELGKSINTDEAAAMGAVYQAAFLGKGFKVKKFGVREGNIYPINVEFERQKNEEEEPKLIKRTLFGRMNPYPQKKVMTFNKHSKDFSFMVTYSGLEFLTEEDRMSFGTPLISKYTLLGVEDALVKNKDKEAKGIKAHFQMDGSGILTLDKVESIFEKNDTDAVEKSTWSKLGSAIGGLFSSGGADEDNKVEDSQEPDEEQPESSEDAADGEKKESEEQPAEKEGKQRDRSEKEDSTQSQQEDTSQKKEEKDAKDDKATTEKTAEDKKAQEAKDKGPKILSIKEIIKTEEDIQDLRNISDQKFNASKKRLAELRKIDKEKMELEKSKNELESFIFDLQDKLTQSLHMKCTTGEERENINAQLSQASDWLYDQTEETKKSEFVGKLKSLKDATKALSKRVYEHEERPKALAALKSALNQTTVFLATVKNITDIEDPIFTQVELDTLEKLINETIQWRDDNVKAQSKLKPYEDPVLKAEDVGLKIASLDREMRYLINKAKNFRPKPKVKEEKLKKTENASEETTSKDSTEQAEVPPADEKEDTEDGVVEEETDTVAEEESPTPTSTPKTTTSTPKTTTSTPKTTTSTPKTPEQPKTPPTQGEKPKTSSKKEKTEEKTSSGKRKPKSKRKSTDETAEEEILQLDDGANNEQADPDKHTEL